MQDCIFVSLYVEDKNFESLHNKINFLNFLRVEFKFSLKLKQMSIVSSSQNRL